jgi:hypothetical protein
VWRVEDVLDIRLMGDLFDRIGKGADTHLGKAVLCISEVRYTVLTSVQRSHFAKHISFVLIVDAFELSAYAAIFQGH